MITLNESSHTYTDETGKVWPSVTQILDPLYDFSGIPKPTLDSAAEKGTIVHKACEMFDLGTLDQSSLDDDIAQYLSSYQLFLVESGFVPDRIEQLVRCDEYGYCGTLDRTGKLGRSTVQIDIKSGQESPVTGPQTAAYNNALNAMTGKAPSKRFGLYLSAERYRLIPYENPNDWRIFRACLDLYNWRKNNG